MSKQFYFKQFSLAKVHSLVLLDPYIGPYWYYHSGPEWTWEWCQWTVTSHSSKLQHYWNLTIRLFSVINKTLVVGGLTSLQRSRRCTLRPKPTGHQVDNANLGIDDNLIKQDLENKEDVELSLSARAFNYFR